MALFTSSRAVFKEAGVCHLRITSILGLERGCSIDMLQDRQNYAVYTTRDLEDSSHKSAYSFVLRTCGIVPVLHLL